VVLGQQGALRVAQARLAVQTEGGLLTEEGGQGIERERDQHQQQQGVLPQAHAVQHGMTLFLMKSASVRRWQGATPGSRRAKK
jgi:sensor histidine kinase regulating citrate/malate metabolism